MKIEFDSEHAKVHKIRSYSNEGFKLKTNFIRSNLVISSHYLIKDWLKEDFSRLELCHLTDILAKRPEILLFGTGKRQIFLKKSLASVIINQNIGFEVMDTGSACRSYNLLVDEGRDVVACLFLPIP